MAVNKHLAVKAGGPSTSPQMASFLLCDVAPITYSPEAQCPHLSSVPPQRIVTINAVTWVSQLSYSSGSRPMPAIIMVQLASIPLMICSQIFGKICRRLTFLVCNLELMIRETSSNSLQQPFISFSGLQPFGMLLNQIPGPG